jgi:hypothetical protein
MKKVTIELGADLQEEYEFWLDAKKALGIERSINNFLYYIDQYGTFKNPKIPTDLEE